MSCYSKEKPERNDYNNICKSHSAKSDRGELYRICPSKLSKRELEDLYFSLLENNLDLKRTINGQQDKIRGLSTKVQRMSAAQKVLQGKEMKECCIGTKSIVSEQKESLTELRRANQRMAERIRMLNMRLCSAKQFYKKAPQMSTSRCIRCATVSTPKKHSCLDKLEKQSEPVLKLSTSCQYIDRDAVNMRSAQTDTRDLEKCCKHEDAVTSPIRGVSASEGIHTQNEEIPCDENRCRSLMEELKLKIVNLQEELSHVHEEYSGRIGRLEAEVSAVRKENARVSGERRASEHELQHAAKRHSDLRADLRTTEGRCAELSTQLSIEKRKVAELETRLKSATISDRVNKTIEDHSTTKLNETNSPLQETKYAQPQNAKLADIPECVCACPTRAKIEKAANKGSNNTTCACPPPVEVEPIVTTPSKSPFAIFSSKSKASKNTPSKAVPNLTSNTKNVLCGCPVQQENDFMQTSPIKDTKIVICACPPPDEMSSPIKETKSVSCACPVWRDSEFVQSTPTKADVVESAPTKDKKCENCTCTGRPDGESYESSSIKTGIHSSPKVADMRVSPRAYHDDGKMSKASDDSGYMDANKSQDTPDEASLNKLNKELIKKILELQSQVDSMKIAGASELPGAKQYKLGENYRSSFSGVTPSTAKSAAEKSGIISEIQKRTDAAECGQPDISMAKSRTSDVGPDKLFFDMSENREMNKLVIQPTIKLDTMEDTGKFKGAVEEHRLSMSNGHRTSIGRTNGHRTSHDTNLFPRLEMPTTVDREEEFEYDRKTEMFPDKLNIPTTDQHASELNFGNGKLVINDYEGQNKPELVPTKLEVPDITENRRGSDIETMSSKLAMNENQVPNMTENRRESDITATSSKLAINGDRVPNTTNNRRGSDIETMPSKLAMNEGRDPNITENRLESDIGATSSKLAMNGERVPNVIENRRESDIGTKTSKLPTNGDRVPNNTEFYPDQLQVQMKEERKLSTDQRVPTDLDLLGNIKPISEDIQDKNESRKPMEGKRLSTTKEECQYCPACTYETECASQSFISKIAHKNNELGGKMMKSDRHNSLQIPGPIPTGSTTNNHNNNKEWKKNMYRQFSDKRRDSKTKDKTAKQKKQPTKDNNKGKASENVREKLKDSYETTGGLINVPDIPILHSDKDTQMTEEPNLSDSKKNYFEESKDSINVHHKRLSNPVCQPELKDTAAPVHDVSMHNFYTHSDVMPSMSMQYNNQEQGTQMEENIDKTLQDQEQLVTTNNNAAARGGRMSSPPCRKRDVSVYRRRSGTLCFRTLPADESPRTCHCEQQVEGRCVGKLKNKATQIQEEKAPNNQRRSSFMTEQGTYTVSSKQNRSTSADNTDIEMSYMSDLPYEKDEKRAVKSRALSPGEDKMTTTYTDSYCSPATNYSLSEGEVPTTSARKASSDNVREKTTPTKPAQEIVPTQSMEAALQAISDELARCKTLLCSQRPTESPLQESNQSQTSMPESSQPIALRRGVAMQSIGDTYTPKCIFTLHIGTVVLSDEAVLNSRDKSLLLMWKFYDQNVAMTRMRAGRVVVFDFSTEYDIKITDDFLSYMKHEELPIVICELDQENEPFAVCTLPLRDALLHTNRRADMSLALVAGPQMLSVRGLHDAAADALDGRDEMGVIDLWCMLRADANMLPGINLAISQPSTTHTHKRHHSRVMQQILDDDHSNEYADMDLSLEKRNAAPVSVGERTGKNVCKDVEFTRTSHHWSKSLKTPPPSSIPTVPTRPEEVYDASKYPPGRSRSNSATISAHTPDMAVPAPAPLRHSIQHDFTDGPEHDGSRIIINEVKAKIKTPSDMKQALERSSFQSEYTRMPKSDEEVSQAHSSLGSSRSFFARLQRRGSPKNEQRRDSHQPNTMFQGVTSSGKGTLETPVRIKERDDTSDLEIYKKYENISKLIGSNRAESKKCVTIVPKYIEPVLDQPQKLQSSQNEVNHEPFEEDEERNAQRLEITVLWLALNEECEAMVDPHVQRVYVAYTFLGRSGAELETPVSLPKPKHYVDKCYFNFKKTFELEDSDLPMLGHMARCRTGSKVSENEKDCIIFSVVSEPPEDPLGLENCEDIGYAYLYLGDLLAYSAGSTNYTEVIPVRGAGAANVCGVLAVRLDGLDVVRRCLLLSSSQRDLADWSMH